MDDKAIVTFESLSHNSFEAIIGHDPKCILLAEDPSGNPLFHEACICYAGTNSIFVTSNQIPHSVFGGEDDRLVTRLFRIHDSSSSSPTAASKVEDITPRELEHSMINGGVNHTQNSILLCAQGSTNSADLSGIVRVPIPSSTRLSSGSSPDSPSALISSFHSRPFNSVNDVVIHPMDQSIWFTDPSYGYHQGFRPLPSLPTQVYRFDPSTGSIRAVADGFVRPNGLCFSPDLSTLYVTDTGAISGRPNEKPDPQGQNHIYAFTITSSPSGSPWLTDRRLFAYADGGCPDGIKCDIRGNVYSGCADGVEVWNSDGILLGRIKVKGGVANFCFGPRGCLYLCNESRFWKIQLNSSVRGALLNL